MSNHRNKFIVSMKTVFFLKNYLSHVWERGFTKKYHEQISMNNVEL